MTEKKKTGYTHGASAGKNGKLLAASLAAVLLHAAFWGSLILACRTNIWYAAGAVCAGLLLILLRLHAGKTDKRM